MTDPAVPCANAIRSYTRRQEELAARGDGLYVDVRVGLWMSYARAREILDKAHQAEFLDPAPTLLGGTINELYARGLR